MNIGSRIKSRRKELGMSADELGAKLGKDRSTIYRYEKGDIENLPLDILNPLAKALHTTESYLMGWEEKETSPSERQLTEGETMLLDLFRRIPEEHQQIVLQMIRAAISNLK